jgi:hypothetical protein
MYDFPDSEMIFIPHSNASLSAFLAAFAKPFFLSSSIALSISQLVWISAFLHSIIPIQVLSLSSLT